MKLSSFCTLFLDHSVSFVMPQLTIAARHVPPENALNMCRDVGNDSNFWSTLYMNWDNNDQIRLPRKVMISHARTDSNWN